MTTVSTNILAPALRKLEKREPFSQVDRDEFHKLPFTIKSMNAGAYIVRQNDITSTCCILVSGFLFKSKIVANGGRQILSIHVPGDMVDLQHALLGVADHNIQMLTAGDVALVPSEAIQDIAFRCPTIGKAMWMETLVDGSIFREWIANVGRRDARTRISHLLCEFTVRLHAAGLTEGNRYEMPMTQEQLGDATGLTSVHVNRTLQGLRNDGLISRDKRSITIEDWKLLSKAGDFDTSYLHPQVAHGLPL
jgi:CRP-like cAMP-binding protein